MKKIEDRREVQMAIVGFVGRMNNRHLAPRSRQSLTKTEVWGDQMPVVRLGSEVGYVAPNGHVYSSVEEAFVNNIGPRGCDCFIRSSQNYGQAINKIALFLVLVALRQEPKEIARLAFHDDLFMFDTFTSAMEDRGLVEHVRFSACGGRPLELTGEGLLGLRMCLESEKVELPFDKTTLREGSLDSVQILLEHKNEPVILPELLLNGADKTAAQMSRAINKGRTPAADGRGPAVV